MIKFVDSIKSKYMFKKHKQYKKYSQKYEKIQNDFINYICKKYHIETKDVLMDYIDLFPESASKFFILAKFQREEKQ